MHVQWTRDVNLDGCPQAIGTDCLELHALNKQVMKS